jgi:hypothetical protein
MFKIVTHPQSQLRKKKGSMPRGGKMGRARRADPFDPQFLTGWGEVFGSLP